MKANRGDYSSLATSYQSVLFHYVYINALTNYKIIADLCGLLPREGVVFIPTDIQIYCSAFYPCVVVSGPGLVGRLAIDRLRPVIHSNAGYPDSPVRVTGKNRWIRGRLMPVRQARDY